MLINVGARGGGECGKVKISFSKRRPAKILLNYIKI